MTAPRTLLLLAHCSPEFAHRYTAALPGVDVRAFVAPPVPGLPGGGLSSRYATLAARLSAEPGGMLPALVRYVGAGSVEGWDRIVLASWSAGYKLAEALFAPLAAGAVLAPPLVGWIALDSGYSALDPDGTASDRQIAPFTALARIARAGDALLWYGHTDLPVEAYADTGDVARELVRLAGPPEGLFRVERWPSDGRPWGEQHSAALLEWGPAFVVGALAALDGAPTPRTGEAPMLRQGSAGPAVQALQRALNGAGAGPPLVEDGAFQLARGLATDGVVGPVPWRALGLDGAGRAEPLGLRALRIAVGEIGVAEVPGPGANARIVAYRSGIERGGRPLHLGAGDEPPWCAAFVGWCLRQAAAEGEQVPPWRAAVAEIWADAERAGTARPAGYEPAPGDLAVMGRAGEDPRRGGRGHVAWVERVEPGRVWTVGGNESDAVRRVVRGRAEVLGWVAMGRG